MKNKADENGNNEETGTGGEVAITLEELFNTVVELGSNELIFNRFDDGNFIMIKPAKNGTTELTCRTYEGQVGREEHDVIFENYCEERFKLCIDPDENGNGEEYVINPDAAFTLHDYCEKIGVSWAAFIGVANPAPYGDQERIDSLVDDYFEVHGYEEGGAFRTKFPTLSSWLSGHGL